METRSRMQRQAGRVLVQTRPVGALLALPFLIWAEVFSVRRGGLSLVLLAPISLLLAGHARWLVRQQPATLRRAAANALVVVGCVSVFALALGPRLLGYETMTVLSTSMEGTFNPGDIILVSRAPVSSVRAGQVLSFHIPTGDHHVVTHRVQTVQQVHGQTLIQTKGDANSVADPWRAALHGGYVWRYRGRLPYAGYPLLFLRGRTVHRVGLYGAPALLVALMLLEIWLPGGTAGLRRRLRHA
jgi:signal peptidase I